MSTNKLLSANLLKAGLIGLLVIVIKLIPLETICGINATTGEVGTMPKFYFIPMFLIYGVIALELANIKSNLNIGKKGAFIIIFMFFFVIDILLSKLEGNFFIEDYPLLFNIGSGFLENILITIGIFYLWKQEDVISSAKEKVNNYFRSRSLFSWVWRVIVVLILSFIIYMIIGAMAYPLTGPYMEKLIKIPTMFENFLIQIFRGVAYLFVTVPIIVFWKKSLKSLLLNLIFINILLYPVLGYAFAYFFPPMFRLIDGIVLSLHMTAFSWLQIKFLKKGNSF
ncbi:hypothetical protein PV797_07680 [Clostridiaceae bacterium M8S5]|nr:hypothetical protein PV797_07680 [Clostridiaceae bacterium M8S5]